MADGIVKIEVLLDDSKVSGGVKKVEGRLSGIASTAKRGLATVGKLAGALGLVGLAYKGIDMVKNSLDGAIDRYDTLNQFPRVMALMGFDAEESEKAINKLSDGIQGLPTRLDEVAATAQSIAIMTGDLDGAVDTTLALNNAFLASGASAQDAQRGLDQYVQMLSKGEVDLQSWRTLQETMPYALRKTAEAFGFTGESATNDFYDALKSGEITMSEFNAKLIELDQAQGGFAETAQTASGGIKTAWTNMKTWIVMGVADVIAAIDDALGGVGSIEGAINSLKPIVQGVFGWIANTAIPAVANGVQWLRDRFNEWRPTLENVLKGFQPFFSQIQSALDNFINHLGPIWENLKQLFNSLLPILSTLGGAFVVLWGTMVSTWTAAISALGPFVEAIINFVDFVVNMVNVIVALLTGDFSAAWEYWQAAGQSALDFFLNLWNTIVTFVSTLVSNVISFFQSLYNTLVGNSIIPDLVKGIIKWFKNLFKSLVDLAKGIVNGVINWFKNLYNQAKNIFNSIRSTIQNIWNNIKNIISTAVNAIRSIVTSVFNAIRSVISSIMNGIRSIITSVWNTIRSIITSVVNAIRNVIRSVFNSLRGIVTGAMNGVKSAIRSGITGALNIITGMAGKFLQAGRKIVTSIADGIKGSIGKITGAIGSVASRIRNFLPFSPAKEGPLRDIMNVQIAESIAEAIRKGRNSAVKEMDKLASDLFETAQPKHDLLANIRGYTPNAVLSGYIPNTVQVTQQLIESTKHRQQQPVIKLETGDVIMDGRKVGEIVWRPVKENIDRDTKIIESFRG